jgi:hypothetical protein
MNLDFRFLNVRQSRFIFYAINVPAIRSRYGYGQDDEAASTGEEVNEP